MEEAKHRQINVRVGRKLKCWQLEECYQEIALCFPEMERCCTGEFNSLLQNHPHSNTSSLWADALEKMLFQWTWLYHIPAVSHFDRKLLVVYFSLSQECWKIPLSHISSSVYLLKSMLWMVFLCELRSACISVMIWDLWVVSSCSAVPDSPLVTCHTFPNASDIGVLQLYRHWALSHHWMSG